MGSIVRGRMTIGWFRVPISRSRCWMSVSGSWGRMLISRGRCWVSIARCRGRMAIGRSRSWMTIRRSWGWMPICRGGSMVNWSSMVYSSVMHGDSNVCPGGNKREERQDSECLKN